MLCKRGARRTNGLLDPALPGFCDPPDHLPVLGSNQVEGGCGRQAARAFPLMKPAWTGTFMRIFLDHAERWFGVAQRGCAMNSSIARPKRSSAVLMCPIAEV